MEGRHVTGIFHDKDMVMKLKSDLVQTTDRGLVNDKRKERGGGEEGTIEFLSTSMLQYYY